MSSFLDRLANEHRRLINGPGPNEKPGGMGTVRFISWCDGDSAQVLERAKSVLKVVNQYASGEWPRTATWRELLPSWFVARCGAELTQEQAEIEMARWRTLSRDEQIRWEEQRRWSLDNWIYWFKPDNRFWYWWDAKALDEKVLVVAVETHEGPFPWGSLAWLLRAAGAQRVEAEE